MRTRTVSVCAGLTRSTALQSHADICHDVLSLRDLLLSEADNVHLLLSIFAAYNFLALIQ